MEPQEKWDKLSNPQSAKDFGISITSDELKTFPEGRAYILSIRVRERKLKRLMSLASMAGMAIGKYERKIFNEVFNDM